MRTLNCPSNVEVLGQNLSAFLNNLQEGEITPIMKKHGLQGFDPNQWYPGPTLFDILNELVQHPNVSSNFVAIGMQIGKIVPMPPDIPDPDLGQVLTIWNNVYQMLHRNGDVGAIKPEKVSEQHYKITFTDLYPDDFSYGIIYGYARRFLPKGTAFKVFYDPEVTPRDMGGNGLTVIHVKW